MTTQNVIVESLREKASSDTVANAVLHMWALRRRARNEVTVNGLYARMKEEGFEHKKEAYEPLLRLMARLGLGRLQQDHKGRVVALRQVDTTLQSLGRAVCDTKSDVPLQKLRRKTRFKNIALNSVDHPVAAPKPQPTAPKAAPKPPVKAVPPATITVTFDAKSITFPLPANSSEEEATFMIGKFLKFANTL